MLRIRSARAYDIRRVCDLVRQLTPGQHQNYRNAIDKFTYDIDRNPDYFLWVAILNEEVIGTVMMHLQHKLSYHCGTAAHVEDLVVDDAYRGEGVGSLLMQKAIDQAKKRSCYKIMLECFSGNVPMYEHMGFKKHSHGMRMSLKQEFE